MARNLTLLLFVGPLVFINVGFFLLNKLSHLADVDGVLRDDLVPTGYPTSTLNSISRNSSWCQYNECLIGRWVPREPLLKNLAEFHATFPARAGQVWSKCALPLPLPGHTRTEEEQRALEGKRLVDVMNWVWKPRIGKQKDWDPEDFVVRLLKSPSGIIIIGDSISQQHEHAFGDSLKQGGIEFVMNPPHLPMHDNKALRQHILAPDTDMTRRLQRRAGVPDSRLKHPIFTIIEEHMLIHEPEIRFITEQFGASKQYNWYHDFKRVEGWERFVADAANHREGEEETVTENTVLLMNAGAHWSRAQLSMLPAGETDNEEQARVIASYRQMAKSVMQKLSPIPRLSVFYRATSPGHPVCGNNTTPYPSAVEAREQRQDVVERLLAPLTTDEERKLKRRWDWDLFDIHNYVWRKEVARAQRERKALQERHPETEPGPRWLFLDLWEMSLQRPDAHSEPGRDCLHWCLPGLYNEWTRHIYHLLFLETQ